LYRYGRSTATIQDCPAVDKKHNSCASKKWTPGFASLYGEDDTLATLAAAIDGTRATNIKGGATAGLRNLWPTQIDLLTFGTPIKLLPGTKEAEYEWFATNFEADVTAGALTDKLAALHAHPANIKNFFSTGGASAQLAVYLPSGKLKDAKFGEFVDNIIGMQGNSLLDFRCSYHWDRAYHEEDFIRVMTINAFGAIHYKSIFDAKTDCQTGTNVCILLVSFLAGQSSDTRKGCSAMKYEKGIETMKFKEADVAHNLIGGVKETFFTLAITKTIRDVQKDSKFETAQGGQFGKFALTLLDDWLLSSEEMDRTKANRDQVYNIYEAVQELMARDAFFSAVTTEIRRLSLTNAWAVGGAVPKITDLTLPASADAEFAWSTIFIKSLFNALGLSTAISGGPKDGDWSYGCAVQVLGFVPVKTCGFPAGDGICADVNLSRGGLLLALENEVDTLFESL